MLAVVATTARASAAEPSFTQLDVLPSAISGRWSNDRWRPCARTLGKRRAWSGPPRVECLSLGLLPGSYRTVPLGVSGNGMVVVGMSLSEEPKPFPHVHAPRLPLDSRIWHCSFSSRARWGRNQCLRRWLCHRGHGGRGRRARPPEAFRWTATTGPVWLGVHSGATGVSAVRHRFSRVQLRLRRSGHIRGVSLDGRWRKGRFGDPPSDNHQSKAATAKPSEFLQTARSSSGTPVSIAAICAFASRLSAGPPHAWNAQALESCPVTF